MSRVADLMSKDTFSCHMDDSLNRCAQIMWEHDCGCVPIVDHASRVVGIITDRDVCMGAYTQGRPLHEIPASSVCARKVHTVKTSDALGYAEDMMTRFQIRRLPVVDDAGRLVGMISLSDLAHHLKRLSLGKSSAVGPRNLSLILEAVSRRRDRVPLVTPVART